MTTDTPPNLLVLCVDCLRDDFVRSDRTDTPFLDSLRADGLDCSNVYSSTTTTTPAMASLLTGTYNERNGVMSLRRGTLSEDFGLKNGEASTDKQPPRH